MAYLHSHFDLRRSVRDGRVQLARNSLENLAERSTAEERGERELLAPDLRERRDVFVGGDVTATFELEVC